MKNIHLIIFSCLLLFTACDPALEDKLEIGTPPQADFTFDFIDPNNVKFTNTTTDSYFISSWDFGTLGVQNGDAVEQNFGLIGDYEVKLTVFGEGGSSSRVETISITQNDPTACITTAQFLSCGEKVWQLDPAEGALWVGPDPGTIWWQNAVSDVTDRACDWNDEYKFSIDGTYEYDSKGDLWGEGYMGFPSEQCYDTSELPADRADWDSGVHAYEILPADGFLPERIRVIGSGAFIGLRKAANGAEVSYPQPEVTYDILDLRTENGKDILELEVNFGGGLWRFRLSTQ